MIDQPQPTPIASTLQPELQTAYRRLSTLCYAMALSVVILSGTLFIFIFRQISLLQHQSNRASAYIQEFRQSNLPETMRLLERELFDFAQKNPDFRPILMKYTSRSNTVARPPALPAAPPN